MSKALRQTLEAKIAALQGPEWDSDNENAATVEAVLEGADSDVESGVASSSASRGGRAKGSRKRAASAARALAGAAAVASSGPSSVVYVGHIPHGFYEEAMKGFFSQFGDVTRVKVSRSIKTARCKGYAFVEFTSHEVAAVVAETMDKYFIYDKQLACEVVPADRVHERMFDGCERKMKAIPWHKIHRQQNNRDRTLPEHERHVEAVTKRQSGKKRRLEALGIAYDLPETVVVTAPAPVETIEKGAAANGAAATVE
ncbi:unnamed protein product, partial [Phaeothamnion confervicola]